jgi:Rha family phage regulatory protein
MNDLVYLKHEEAMTDSLSVAERFEKRHDRVLRAIENVVEGLPKNEETQQMFVKTWYKHPQNGERYTKYLMNRDGFSLLVMGFTGKKALEWKLKYISAFNSMEDVIRERTTSAWIETREYGKLTRKAETDTLKKLVELAKEQGSEHSEMLYLTYSKLANKMAGITNRDEATVKQLNELSLVENIILHVIDMGIFANKHYKEIYRDCKVRLEAVSDLAFLTA